MADSPVIDRVRLLVEPIVSDLQLDLYDLEMRGGTLRVVLDTPAGSESGVSLDTLTLATRLISSELDHSDPIPGSYQLEVTSPGLERHLRLPAHFQREVGKVVTVRLANSSSERRLVGTLVDTDGPNATIEVTSIDGTPLSEPERRVIAIADIDKARTVFEWGPQPKKGGQKKGKSKKGSGSAKTAASKPGSVRAPEHTEAQ